MLIVSLFIKASCGQVGNEDKKQARSLSALSFASLNGIKRTIAFNGYVYTHPNSSTEEIKLAIARQIQSATGPLMAMNISLACHNLTKFLAKEEWAYEPLEIFLSDQKPSSTASIWRIRYSYQGKVIASKHGQKYDHFTLPLLMENYASHIEELADDCTDEQEMTNLWYYFRPGRPACHHRISSEEKAVELAKKDLPLGARMVSLTEVNRLFLPVQAELRKDQLDDQDIYPDYTRLFRLSSLKNDELIIYLITGVDFSSGLPSDPLGLEHLKMLRRLLLTYPQMKIHFPETGDHLFTLQINNQVLRNVTLSQLFSWILDQKHYPASLGSDRESRYELHAEIMTKFAEHWLDFELPTLVSKLDASGQEVKQTINVRFRSFYGNEHGSHEIMEKSKLRYREAFKRGDIVIYNGHSHFGHSALKPSHYLPTDFKDGYQIFLFNSCFSFKYFHAGFFELKPESFNHLDIVSNALRSSLENSGEAIAAFIQGILQEQSYQALLLAMSNAEGEAFEALRLMDGRKT